MSDSAANGRKPVAYDARNRALVMWIDSQGFTLVCGCDCRANCDGSTAPPVLTAADFMCFQEYFASGCH
jgi:hypothetical protein